MINSMQSAIAGLKSHQTKMDVIGNNIANVNTWGYKSKSVNFADSMYQNYTNGSAGVQANGGRGAVGTSQIGFGSTVSSITSNFETGSRSYTGNPYDCMIDGPAFFIVGLYSDQPITDANLADSPLYLSKVGIFQTPDGFLTDDKGNYVYGYTMTNDDPPVADTAGGLKPIEIKLPDDAPADAEISSMSIGKDGSVTVTDQNNNVYVVAQLAVATVENTGGLEQSSGYLYSFGSGVGQVTASVVNAGTGDILAGYLEMPNVDLATEMANMITTQRGYQANTKMITVSDQMLEELVNMKR